MHLESSDKGETDPIQDLTFTAASIEGTVDLEDRLVFLNTASNNILIAEKMIAAMIRPEAIIRVKTLIRKSDITGEMNAKYMAKPAAITAEIIKTTPTFNCIYGSY